MFGPSRNKPLNHRSALATLTILGQIVLIGSMRQETSAAGIALLDENTYKQAISCGHSGEDCAVARYQLCPDEIAQYSARIATPFSRVAYSVFERVSRRQRVRAMELGVANLWGLGIYASPSDNYSAADSIKRVVLKRGGRTVEPTTTTLGPIVVEHEGQSKELMRGFFAFPIEALSPGSEVTVVFTGTRGDVSCTLSRERLATLR
jgi:hypothetical protein